MDGFFKRSARGGRVRVSESRLPPSPNRFRLLENPSKVCGVCDLITDIHTKSAVVTRLYVA